MSNNIVSAFGVQFYVGTRAALLQDIDNLTKRSFSYIVTPNINHVVRLRADEQLRSSYAHAAFQLCDSRVVRILLSFLGCSKGIEVIPGSDLTRELILVANDKVWAVSVVGASSSDMEKIRSMSPNVKFFHYDPPMGFIDRPDEVEKCIDFVEQNKADLVLLAVGCPRQEILAERILSRGTCHGVGLCIGASVLFLSGSLRRAPKWVQSLCLEWLFRMVSEPRRLIGRYASDAIGIFPVFFEELFKRIKK